MQPKAQRRGSERPARAPAARAARRYVLPRLPGHLIRRLQQAAVSILLDEFDAEGSDLTPVQYAALFAISAYPRIDQASLAGLIAYDQATIGGVIDRLESKGLISRSVSSHDRRLRQLVTRSAGENLLDRLGPATERAQERILGPLTPAERRIFTLLLSKLVIGNNEESRAPMRPVTRSAVPGRNGRRPRADAKA